MKKTPKEGKSKKVKGKSKDNRETLRLAVSSSFLLFPFYFCLDLVHQHARIQCLGSLQCRHQPQKLGIVAAARVQTRGFRLSQTIAQHQAERPQSFDSI